MQNSPQSFIILDTHFYLRGSKGLYFFVHGSEIVKEMNNVRVRIISCYFHLTEWLVNKQTNKKTTWCANAVTYDKTADNVPDVSTRAVLDEISPPQVGAIAVISGLPSLRELGGSLVSRCDVTEGG